MAEVVIDDMAIGNPASLMAQLGACEALFPGIHIAQFPSQVIGNCGVIIFPGAMQQSPEAQKVRKAGITLPMANQVLDSGFLAGTTPAIGGWRCTQYDGIVA